MTAPDTIVLSSDDATSGSTETNSGIAHISGFTERGSVTAPIPVRSMSQAIAKLGSRAGGTAIYDWLDTFFHEGGALAYVTRVTGPTPTLATVNVSDGSGTTAVIKAANPGSWGADLDVVFSAGSTGNFVAQLLYQGEEVLKSGDLADVAALQSWAVANLSDWITVTNSAGGDPAVGTASLAGGTDDRGSATNGNWKTAAARSDSDFAPGQLLMPGRTAAQAHADLIELAEAGNFVALLDGADVASKATLVSAAATDRSAGSNERFGAFFGSWALIPGVADDGTTRTVPWSAVVAGHMAKLAAQGRSPNIAAAGDMGVSDFVLGLTQPAWTKEERSDLNEAGVNIARFHRGRYKTYGFRTLVDPTTDSKWLQLTQARLDMEIRARAGIIADGYLFGEIDGQGHRFSDLARDLNGMLKDYWPGSLYGSSPGAAFRVDVGESVNTEATIAAGEINAVIYYRIAPFGELVRIVVSKKPITEAI